MHVDCSYAAFASAMLLRGLTDSNNQNKTKTSLMWKLSSDGERITLAADVNSNSEHTLIHEMYVHTMYISLVRQSRGLANEKKKLQKTYFGRSQNHRSDRRMTQCSNRIGLIGQTFGIELSNLDWLGELFRNAHRSITGAHLQQRFRLRSNSFAKDFY